jgi:predicted alpha/beta hydrolase
MPHSAQSRSSLNVRLADGASVELTVFAASKARVQFLCVPALGVEAAYYEPLARSFAAAGIDCVTADLRSLGLSSVRVRRGVDFGYRQLVDDLALIVDAVAALAPTPLYLLGHSLGGQVSALLAGSRPLGLAGLVLCACGTPWYRLYRMPLSPGLYAFAHLAGLSSRVLGYYPGRALRFAGTEAAQLMQEWSRLARRGRFDIAGLDGEETLARSRLPTLSISLAHDRLTPRETIDHLAAKLCGAPVTRVHLDESTAPRRSLDHFRWAREPAAVVDAVSRWLESAPRPR